MSELCAAVIGVGYLGNFHAQKYKQIPGVRLVAVVDSDSTRRTHIADRLGVEGFENHEEILSSVDIVSIVVPPAQHYAIARDCLMEGVHCLVEKPLTELVSHAEDLIDIARSKSVVLQVGHLERFNPVARKLAGLIDSPRLIKTRRFSEYQPRGTETDVILDLMIHDIDIVLSLASGSVSSVRATGASVMTEHIDIANARIDFSDGLVAELQASRVSSEAIRESEIVADGRIFKINYLTHEACVRSDSETDLDGESVLPIFGDEQKKVDALYQEILSFVVAVTSGTLPLVTGEDGKKALELAVEISKRIKLSKNTLLPDILGAR